MSSKYTVNVNVIDSELFLFKKQLELVEVLPFHCTILTPVYLITTRAFCMFHLSKFVISKTEHEFLRLLYLYLSGMP